MYSKLITLIAGLTIFTVGCDKPKEPRDNSFQNGLKAFTAQKQAEINQSLGGVAKPKLNPPLTGTWHQVDSPSYTLTFFDKGDWQSSTGTGGRYTVSGSTITLQDQFGRPPQTAEIQGNEIILDGAHFRKE